MNEQDYHDGFDAGYRDSAYSWKEIPTTGRRSNCNDYQTGYTDGYDAGQADKEHSE